MVANLTLVYSLSLAAVKPLNAAATRQDQLESLGESPARSNGGGPSLSHRLTVPKYTEVRTSAATPDRRPG